MTNSWLKTSCLGLGIVVVMALGGIRLAFADGPFRFDVHASVFDPFHTKLVLAEWEKGAGCPINATINPTGAPPNSTFTDPLCPDGDPNDPDFEGLVLMKTGPTANFASAGADINGVKGITLTEIGYDIRKSGHCGAGAPRFDVQATDGFHFLGGCANATQTTLAGSGWIRVRIDPSNAGQAFPPIAAGAKVISISIVFYEGSDAGTDFSRLAVLDNIDINGTLEGEGNH